jgi:uncharacterized protein (DUF342 family)
MNQPLMTLDPRAQKLGTAVKVVGVGAVAVVASGVVVAAGASLAVASVVGVVGLFSVNYLVPVAARMIAVWRQKSLTVIAETFSEETIREDEVKESDRIRVLEQQYVSSRAELENAQEELRKQMKTCSEEEKVLLDSQVQMLSRIISESEEELKTRKSDFVELQRVNKLYIALHRSAAAMQKAQGSTRNSEEMQRIETARTAIKSKMRQAIAGKTIDSINSSINVAKPRAHSVLGDMGGH